MKAKAPGQPSAGCASRPSEATTWCNSRTTTHSGWLFQT